MKALLIPSAILIPREMRARMGTIPTCLFPLNGQTMLQLLCEKYSGIVDKVYVVVNREKQQIIDYVSLKKLPIHIVEMAEVRDLGYTIFTGLEAIWRETPDVEQVYINFADTLLSNPPSDQNRDAIYYAREKVSEDWSYFECENGLISNLIDKVLPEQGSNQYGNAFTGVFQISHPKQFSDVLVEAVKHPKQFDSFYAALIDYSRQFPFDCILAGKWFDVGHNDRYIQAKTGVEARSFNTIDLDGNRGVLRKRSENRDKLIDEIKWYLKIPSKLQYLLPRIYDYSLDRSAPYVSMEYYGYNTLHEMLVYGDMSDTQWENIFEKILFVVQDMKKFQVEVDTNELEFCLTDMYISKTIQRLEKLRENVNFEAFFNNKIIVNGKEYPSLNECIEFLPGLLRDRLIQNASKNFNIIHGDLCFSNILVANGSYFLRIIDPRGKFGTFDIYGDRRYELAKLMHSMDGQYDYITEDMFFVQVEQNHITLEMPVKTKDVYNVFLNVFKDELVDYQDLKLIESTLFLSMLPLHSDALNRQYAMLATGMRLLGEATGGNYG